MVSKPLRCWSTGREPMAQPPGRLTCASPKRASVGPSTRIDARMVLTNSYGAQVLLTVPPLISNSRMLSVSTRAPMPCSSFCVVFTSASIGTFFRRSVPEVRRPAHIKGSAAFFAPDTVISPLSGPLAEILSLSMAADFRGKGEGVVGKTRGGISGFFPPIPQAWRPRKRKARAARSTPACRRGRL